MLGTTWLTRLPERTAMGARRGVRELGGPGSVGAHDPEEEEADRGDGGERRAVEDLRGHARERARGGFAWGPWGRPLVQMEVLVFEDVGRGHELQLVPLV